MSNKSKSVFPLDPDYYNKDAGMTLRDYFAAKALPIAVKEMDEIGSTARSDGARIAYEYADAMMEARNV
jgi:hypothetical protein